MSTVLNVFYQSSAGINACYMHPICLKITQSVSLSVSFPNSRAILRKSDFSREMQLFRRNSASGFTTYNTAEDVTDGIDGSGLTAIVTGSSSGIGAETARVLALRGVHVVMAVRNVSAGEQVKEKIVKAIPSAKLETMELDLSSMASVKKFASEYTSSGRPLNLLINNAGVTGTPFELSKDGIELHFATNYIGHFLLTKLLLDTMKRTAGEMKREGRIVIVSSLLHRFTYKEGIRFDRINEQESYNRVLAYGQSKLATLLYSNELARRLKEDGANVTSNALHPGIVSTNVYRFFTVGFWGVIFKAIGDLILKNPPRGASTSCYLALHPQLEGITGEYFANNNATKPTALARDADFAKKLWDFTMDLIK